MPADAAASYEAGGVTVRPGPGGPRPEPYPAEVVITRRAERVDRLPRRPELFLDRVDERAKCSLAPPFVLELYGDHGVGKSTLLNAMAHELASGESFADGVVYCDHVFYTSYSDLLNYLWDHFYESNLSQTFVPSPATLYRGMTDLDALIVIDDFDLDDGELTSLAASLVRRGSLIFASENQRLTAFGRSLLVTGLPAEVAGGLARAQLRRQFLDEDLLSDEIVAQAWTECGGNAKLFERSIARWAAGGPTAGEAYLIDVVMHLSGRTPVPVEVLQAVASVGPRGPVGVPDLAAALWRRREIEAHSPRYSVRWQLPPNQTRAGLDENQRAFRYLADEVDFDERPELRRFALGLLDAATAVGSGALPAAAMAVRSEPSGIDQAVWIASRLADSYLSSGSLDGWQAAALAMSRLDRLERDRSSPVTRAWAAHHLGANFLCRGAFPIAERVLRDAADLYEGLLPASSEALDSVSALRDLVLQSSEDE